MYAYDKAQSLLWLILSYRITLDFVKTLHYSSAKKISICF